MRIAIVAPLVTPIREPQLGGSQAVVADLAAGLQQRGHHVDVYASSGSAIQGVRVLDTGVDSRSLASSLYRASAPMPSDSSAGAAMFAKVYAAIGETPYDVVHNHAFDAPAIQLAINLPWPVVHTLHLPPDRRIAAAITLARQSRNPPTVAAVSASQSNAWSAVVQVDRVLRDGVPVERIPWSATPGRGVVFAGRFSPEKGAEDAIEIARLAGVAIDLFGEPYDPDYARSRVEPHRHDPGVRIHGGLTRAELWRVMARSRAVLCPAKWEEPFGMVAAEAEAAGTPVVAYRRGALSEIVVDQRTGYLVAPDDVGAAASAVGKVDTLQREVCRRHAEAHLNLEESIAAHERLYTTIRRPARATGHG